MRKYIQKLFSIGDIQPAEFIIGIGLQLKSVAIEEKCYPMMKGRTQNFYMVCSI